MTIFVKVHLWQSPVDLSGCSESQLENDPSASSSSSTSSSTSSSSSSSSSSGGNLVVGADGTSNASGSQYAKIYDGDYNSNWMPASSSNERISANLGSTVMYNKATIYEMNFATTAWRLVNNSSGEQVASGTNLANGMVINFPTQTGSQLDLFIDSANSAPMIAEFEVYYDQSSSSSPTGPNNCGPSHPSLIVVPSGTPTRGKRWRLYSLQSFLWFV